LGGNVCVGPPAVASGPSRGLSGVATVPVWSPAAVKVVLPEPAPAMPIRLPPPLVKGVAALTSYASGPETVAVFPAIIVVRTVVVPNVKFTMPPPTNPALLPETVLFVTVIVPLPAFSMPPPLPFGALLPETVLFATVVVPPLWKMPPPSPWPLAPTVLPEMVLFVTVSVPPLLEMPPPSPPVVLPETVLFVTVSVPPSLAMPPPGIFPPERS
jgi:hypothetical protein